MIGASQRHRRRGQRGGFVTRDRRRRQRGQIIVMFTLSMSLFMFTLFVVVVDLDYLFTWSSRVQAAAENAAQSGANSVTSDFLYTGKGPIIDTNSSPGNASYYERACRTAGNRGADIPLDKDYTTDSPPAPDLPEGTHCLAPPQPPPGGACEVGATVVKYVKFPITVLGIGARVRGSFVAAPVIGANAPTVNQGTCPYQPPPP